MSTSESEALIPARQFSQIMEAITSSRARMEEKLTEFKTEVRQGQEDAAARALMRARYEKPYAFKRKGNKEQANFNVKLDEAIAEAEVELAEAGPSTTPPFQRGLQALQQGRKLIAERQNTPRTNWLKIRTMRNGWRRWRGQRSRRR